MTWHVKVAGTWQEITKPEVKVAGVWQPIQEGWVNVSGTWQRFFTAATFPLDGTTTTVTSQTNDPGTATAGWRIKRDGTTETHEDTVSAAGTYTFAGDWIDPTAATVGDDYEVRLTPTTGSIDSGSAVNTWLALSTDRTWEIADSTLSGQSFEGTVEIRRTSDSSVVSTHTLSMSASTTI